MRREEGEEGGFQCTAWKCTGAWILDVFFCVPFGGGCKEKFPGFILEYSDGFIEYILSTCNHSCYDIRLKNVAVDWMSENEGLSDVLPVVRSSHTI
jgi:hypothetical protein